MEEAEELGTSAERCVMGNRQDGMWTGKAGEIFGVRREEIGAVVLGDGRRGGGGALLGVWCEEMGRAERASFELGGKKTNLLRSQKFRSNIFH